MSDNTDEESGLWASIHASLGGIHDTLKSMHKHQTAWIQRASDEFRDFDLRGNGIATAMGTTFSFSLESVTGNAGPPNGRVWILRRLTIGPPLVTNQYTATAAWVFKSPVDPLYSGSLGSLQLVDTFFSAENWPQTHFYSSRQVVLRNPDLLWVVVESPGAANNQWVGSGAVEDYADGGYRAEQSI